MEATGKLTKSKELQRTSKYVTSLVYDNSKRQYKFTEFFDSALNQADQTSLKKVFEIRATMKHDNLLNIVDFSATSRLTLTEEFFSAETLLEVSF